MEAPRAILSKDGKRLRLIHGPIDVLIGAEGHDSASTQHAFEAATLRFASILSELTDELPILRAQCEPGEFRLKGTVARRMEKAAQKHAKETYITPMAAVAGAVSEEILAAMRTATLLHRAYVNNGGDIALHLDENATFTARMAAHGGAELGTITLTAVSGICGVATSGRMGRSLSLGIADSVTVLAATATDADAAATLIANAVDLPGHPGIAREPASNLQPDSDLGKRLVVTGHEGLSARDICDALDHGQQSAEQMNRDGVIKGAALFLGTQSRLIGSSAQFIQQPQ